MPLPSVSQFLVDDLQALPLLDGRFEGMTLVNFNSAQDQRRGCFSLVFRAHDQDNGRDVALKFFDPSRAMDEYRLKAFHREHEILEHLLGVDHCLQLASDLKTYQLQVPIKMGPTISLHCEYFAVEWIEEEIDKYFLCQEQFSALEKLMLFASLAASVEILHLREVFHRDLKPDNLRLAARNGSNDVIPIDLGTAARFSSAPIQTSYADSVGASAYASPEAYCGRRASR